MLRKSLAPQAAAHATGSAESNRVAADAYIFGYPLVLMDVTREVATAAASSSPLHAPTNTFHHMRSFPDASFTDVVSPNADTLYSTAWLDLKEEPIVLSVPELGPRYYVMQLLDAWTNVFANPGTRTTGGDEKDFAICGPDWSGALPSTLIELRSPTNMVWLVGRTQTNGRKDYTAVHQIQEQYQLTPLSVWGTAHAPPNGRWDSANIDTRRPPVEQVARMDAATFFGCLNVLMQANPPSRADARALERFAPLGIRPGAPIDEDALHPALSGGVSAGRTRILEHARSLHNGLVNGWELQPHDVGRYGTNYLLRASIAMTGLGANIREDAVYAHAFADVEGGPLRGANKFKIVFPKGAVPPVKAFWSITMYNAKQAFAENPLDRYAIGDRDDLTMDTDGSLTILVQHESPGPERERNWLPAPAEAFNLVMRLYWPSEAILSGRWTPPPIRRIG